MVAQILIPYAAHLAPGRPNAAGSSAPSRPGCCWASCWPAPSPAWWPTAWGWRTIYLASAVLMVVLSVLLTRMLPKRLAGVQHLPAADAVDPAAGPRGAGAAAPRRVPCADVRRVQLLLDLGGFRADPAASSQPGLDRVFALVGAAGAAAAPLAGRLGDRGHGHPARVVLALGAVAMILAGLGAESSSCWPWPGSCWTSPSRATRSSASG